MAYLPLRTQLCSFGLPEHPPWSGSPLAAPLIAIRNSLGEDVSLFSGISSDLDLASASRIDAPAGSLTFLQGLLPRSASLGRTAMWSYVCVRTADGAFDTHGLIWNASDGYSFLRAEGRYRSGGVPAGSGATSLLAHKTWPLGPWPRDLAPGAPPWLAQVTLRRVHASQGVEASLDDLAKSA